MLSRDGAHVVGLDVPPLEDDLNAVVRQIGGSAIAADITEDDAPARIADHLAAEHEGVDIVVHNAGVTKDKTLGRMDAERWDLLMDINLSAQERIDDGPARARPDPPERAPDRRLVDLAASPATPARRTTRPRRPE